jgi:6-phosphofructokinase
MYIVCKMYYNKQAGFDHLTINMSSDFNDKVVNNIVNQIAYHTLFKNVVCGGNDTRKATKN